MDIQNEPRSDYTIHVRHVDDDSSTSDSDTDTSNSTATPRSLGRETPRANLLWDHGYDVADIPGDGPTNRDHEWKKFNITDDDKLNADRHAVERRREKHSKISETPTNTEHVKEHEKVAASNYLGKSYLPDLLAFIGSADTTGSQADMERIDPQDSATLLTDTRTKGNETDLPDNHETPPPLPATSPPPLSTFGEIAESESESHTDINRNPELLEQTSSDTTTIDDSDEATSGMTIDDILQSLLHFKDQIHVRDNASNKSQTQGTTSGKSNDFPETIVKSDNSDTTDSSDEEDEQKNDVEAEFEAILHAFDLNFGQDTYAERFAGRRDKYGFILSPINEAPSPTPSFSSGYSGISSASPDPFSVFRMSPAPLGNRLDLDLSSLSVYPCDIEDTDQTVPIYQTVQAKKAIVIPEGYGWDSGDDLLSPTGSGEWDLSENGLSSPPVSTSGINLSQFGTHVIGWKQPKAPAIPEEPEVNDDSEETVDGESSSGDESDSTLEELHQNQQAHELDARLDKNISAHNDSLNTDNDELEYLANVKMNSLEKNQFEDLRANQRTPIAEYLNKQSQRPVSNQSVASDSMSETSTAEDAEDEYSESELENRVNSVLTIEDENDKADTIEDNDDQNVSVSEILSPRTAILMSGGMYPEDSDSSYLTDDEAEGVGEEEKQDRDSNMSSYGSGVLVSQYTSADSDDGDTESIRSTPQNVEINSSKYLRKNVVALSPESKTMKRPQTPMKIPLDFSLIPNTHDIQISRESPLSSAEEEKRSPRVFGRYYTEIDEDIIEEASVRNAKQVPKMDVSGFNHTPSDLLSRPLSPEEKARDEMEKSFTNIEFKNLTDIPLLNNAKKGPKDSSSEHFKERTVADKPTMVLKEDNHPKDIKVACEDTKIIAETRKNVESVDNETGVNQTRHAKKSSHHQASPVNIKVSKLGRKGSFTDKVKRGFVQQLSELFGQKETDIHKTPKHKKETLKNKTPDSEPDSLQMIFPKENVVILERRRDSQIESINLNESTMESANESLGFEVTTLQRVDAFEDNEDTSHVSDLYEDDFESDTDESEAFKQDGYIQLYEKQLELNESPSAEISSEIERKIETTISDTRGGTDTEEEISEQIEGSENDESDDEELFNKIHARDGLFYDSKRTPDVPVKKQVQQKTNYTEPPRASAISKEEDIEEVIPPGIAPQSRDLKNSTSNESNYIHVRLYKGEISRPRGSLDRPDTRNIENEKTPASENIKVMPAKAPHNEERTSSGVDVSGIFWGPKLQEYKPPVSEKKDKDTTKSARTSKRPFKEGSYLFEIFSQLDKKIIPEEHKQYLHTSYSSKTDVADVPNYHLVEPRESDCQSHHSISPELPPDMLNEAPETNDIANEAIQCVQTSAIGDSPAKNVADAFPASVPDTNSSAGRGELEEPQKLPGSSTQVVQEAVQAIDVVTDDQSDYDSDSSSAFSRELMADDLSVNSPREYTDEIHALDENKYSYNPVEKPISSTPLESYNITGPDYVDDKAGRHLVKGPKVRGDFPIRYPASLSRRLYGPYCRVNNIEQDVDTREATPLGLSEHSEAPVTYDRPTIDIPLRGRPPLHPEKCILTDMAPPNNAGDFTNRLNQNSGTLPQEFKLFEYPEDDSRSSNFRNDRSLTLSNKSNGLDDLETDLTDTLVENIDGRILYPDVFEHSCYDVKAPFSSPAQRESLKPQSIPITYCNSAEAQQDGRSEIVFSKSDQLCASGPEPVNNEARNDKQKLNLLTSPSCNNTVEEENLPVISRVHAENLDYADEQNTVHVDLNKGGSSPQTAVNNDLFHDELGVCSPREIITAEDACQIGTMRNDMQPNETKLNKASAGLAGINGFSSGQTDSICQPHMSKGKAFTYNGKESDKKSLGAAGGDSATVVLVQTTDCQHVLEDEKGNLKKWPYSDFENSHKVPVTLHRAKRIVKMIVKKSGMTDAPSNMTVIQTAQHSTERPENRMTEKYHSSSVLPEDRNVGQLMQTHGESVQDVLFKDTNGNTLTEEELSAILPKIADSMGKMKDVDAEEILPGITQSITKLQNGGNLVITTMTRKLDEVESDESGRGSPEPPHPVLHVDDLENSRIYLVRDSKGELFYVEDISESHESAYFSSRNTSESDGGCSPSAYQKISEIKQVGQSGIQGSTAEELISAMYNEGDIQEISENEEEWSERTYEFSGPKTRQGGYSKDSFRSSYVVEEPDTLPRAGKMVSQDRLESSYEISGGSMPWLYDGGMSQSYSQVTQAAEDVDSASAISGAAVAGTRTQEVLTVEAEAEIYPLVPVSTPPVPALLPPVAVQSDTPHYSLIKVDVTPKKEVSTKVEVTEQSKTIEVDDRPIYKTVAHIHTREKQPPVKSEMAEPKRYRIVSSKATETDAEEQETRMSLDEVDYKFSAENMEYKVSPTLQQTQYYVRNTAKLETPATYKTERTLEINNNSTDQKYKTEIQVNDNSMGDLIEEESNFYSFDEMKAKMEQSDSRMKVVRGSYMIKNNLEEVDGEYDDNLNMFDGNFTLRKDNPLYQSDEDLYRKWEREKAEQARRQDHFQSRVNQDVAFETVDRFSKSKTVKREEIPKQSLSDMLLSRLSTVDSKDIRQKIDVKHHSEDIYGDPRFIHADGSVGAQSSAGRSDFDSVGEKVDLLIKDGKAFITVKVTAERIVPLDMEFNVWRKNQAIVSRIIEVDLLATEHRRRLYYQVMEEVPGGSRGPHKAGPNETILDSKQTLELFTKILGAADGEGDKEDITVRTRSGRTTRPFTSGMDLMY